MQSVAIFPGFILLLLAAVMVIAVVKLCSKRLSLAAVVAVLLSLFAVAFLFFGLSHRRVEPARQLILPRLKSDIPEHTAAIWQPGIEDEFEANIYPSKLSAVRSLGLRISEPIRQLFGDQEWPKRGIVFDGGHDRAVLDEFIKTATRKFPQTNWIIASETMGVQPDEVGVRLDLSAVQSSPAPWQVGSEIETTRGTFRASVLADNRQISINAGFMEKPWIENFYGAWNNRPNRRLIIAKSAESCLTHDEANHQAIADACNQLTELLRQTPRAQATPSLPRNVTSNDILEGGFIVDWFAQKFDGRAGEIWRHALLIDASVEKMEQLAERKVVAARVTRLNWARMIASVVGLLALITAAYAFLNAATRGYYTWSLRIAGIVLAAAVIILFVV